MRRSREAGRRCGGRADSMQRVRGHGADRNWSAQTGEGDWRVQRFGPPAGGDRIAERSEELVLGRAPPAEGAIAARARVVPLHLPPRRGLRIARHVGDGRAHAVVHQRLLVHVGEEGRFRPRHVPRYGLGLEHEEMDPAGELAQHPGRPVALADVLRVEDASVDHRPVFHRHNLLAAVDALQGRVRVRQPHCVGVSLQYIDAQLDGHPRQVVLTYVIEVEGEAPVQLHGQPGIGRLRRGQAR
eukprot:scaffold17307_cov119-Isochrysis_galbana.AAC.6